MTSPFGQIAQVLATQYRPSFPAAPARKQQREGVTRTDSIRDLLRTATRPMGALEIAIDLDLPSSCTVWLLMKADMQKGRVLLRDGRYLWSHDYDDDLADELSQAKRLLQKHGYRVTLVAQGEKP